MAVTATRIANPEVPGARRYSVTDIVGDTSYPTGGWSVTADQLGLSVVDHNVTVIKVAGTNGPVHAHYLSTTAKLKCYSATAEISNATDLSGVTFQITAHGK